MFFIELEGVASYGFTYPLITGMKIRHSAPHLEPHSFLAFELCAHVSISKYVKQEDEKPL